MFSIFTNDSLTNLQKSIRSSHGKIVRNVAKWEKLPINLQMQIIEEYSKTSRNLIEFSKLVKDDPKRADYYYSVAEERVKGIIELLDYNNFT